MRPCLCQSWKLHFQPGRVGNLGDQWTSEAVKAFQMLTAGPAREIHAGSGYWSQDSTMQVFGTPASPTQVRVRWPGGKELTSALPSGAREIAIDQAGRINVKR